MSEYPPEIAPDWRGRNIYVGDTVLYPRGSGRSVEMQEGRVLAIVRHFADRRVYLGAGASAELVPHYKFRIQPTRSSRRFYRDTERPVWIQNGENVTLAV